MKIIKLTAENVKRLVAVEIEPTGNLVEITGANGAGKSSVLDAIWWALAGQRSHQPEPIRTGQEKALIELDLGEMTVRRTFTRRKKKGGEEFVTTTLHVETAEGARYQSPQELLDGLIERVSFDPLAFARMDGANASATLRALVGLDVSELEVRSQDAYAARTDTNRRKRDNEAAAAAITVPDDAPDQPIDVNALLTRLEEAEQENRKLAEGHRNRQAVHEEVRAELGKAKAQLAEAQARESEAKEALLKATARSEAASSKVQEHTAAVEALPSISPPEFLPVVPIKEQIAGAEAKNAAWRARQEKTAFAAAAADAQKLAEKYTAEIKKCAAEIAKKIEAADMPVPGLSLSDGQVTLNDLPFGQASDAEKLRVSCAIAMRKNQKLRVIRIRDGSLLDEENMEVLRAMADEHDCQVWIERVDTTGKVGIVIEDGRVKEMEQ